MSEQKHISIYQVFSGIDKNILLLAIDTLSPQDKAILKKKFGDEYSGNGFLLYNEKNTYEMIERRLSRRVKEVEEMLKNNKNEDEIITYYQKLSSPFSLYKSYQTSSQEINNFKLQKTFIENFPVQYYDILINLLNKIDDKDKELIQKFYFGKNYDILRKDIDNNELKNIYLLINRLKEEARKKFQHKQKNSNIKINNDEITKKTLVKQKNR